MPYYATLVAIFLAPLAWGVTTCQAQSDEAAKTEPSISPSEREHWSFQRLASPEPPHVGDTDWLRNPVDYFVLQRLRENNLDPAPEANRQTLIRRVTFDLTGLPPTPDEVSAFLDDARPDAYERLIDRLLASPAYGQRWAQHWLDLARYAETDGFEHDKVRPDAWRYRDWVIKALNKDLPFSEFVRLQIAGDLIHPGNRDATIATGFALCGPDMVDLNLVAERKHVVLNDITGTVGSVFLGIQMGCAECHDHKYDPVSQADFYRLRAFFETSLHYQPNGYETKGKKPPPLPPKPVKGRILYQAPNAQPQPTHLWVRGDFRSPGPQVEPGFPRIALNEGEAVHPEDGSRVALANWLASDQNFLVRRVIVNRLWQHHFGRGLVDSPSDFGLMGGEPSHPALLDWLADELSRRDDSLKAMHRLMLTSAAYRQASRLTSKDDNLSAAWENAKEVDPQNRLLWRANRKRLEGETIRDAMLASCEQLSDRQGGMGVRPPLPKELTVTLLKNQWKVSKNEEDHRRRSIYLFVRRNLRYPIFEVFDRPNTNMSCPRRAQSTIAPQALVLLNSDFSLEQAKQLAIKVTTETPPKPEARVRRVYERTLSRQPDQDELLRATEFLAQRAQQSRNQPEEGPFREAAQQLDGVNQHDLAALTYLSLAAYNLNEFVYVD